MKRNALPFGLAAVAGLVIGCAAWAAEMEIGQKDSAFSKEEVTIKAGDTLKFLNDDTIVHNVSVSGPSGKKSYQTQKPGESLSVHFDVAGQYDIRCLIHPKMKMTVVAQ